MKQLLIASATAAALVSGSAFAIGGIDIDNDIALSCDVDVSAISGPLTFENGTATASGIGIQCNDSDGATVRVTSQNGALEGPVTVSYELTLSQVGGSSEFTTINLNANGTTSPASADTDVNGSAAFAGDGFELELALALVDDLVFAGRYRDTVTIDITPL